MLGKGQKGRVGQQCTLMYLSRYCRWCRNTLVWSEEQCDASQSTLDAAFYIVVPQVYTCVQLVLVNVCWWTLLIQQMSVHYTSVHYYTRVNCTGSSRLHTTSLDEYYVSKKSVHSACVCYSVHLFTVYTTCWLFKCTISTTTLVQSVQALLQCTFSSCKDFSCSSIRKHDRF